MRKLIIVLILMLTSSVIVSQYKHEYDIQKSDLKKTASSNSVLNSSVSIENEYLEAALLGEGYFTIGTHAGNSSGVLDDNCQITFGHPFAKTSYPVVFIDGRIYKLEELFDCMDPQVSENSLSLNYENDVLALSYNLILTGKSVKLKYNITNKSGGEQNMALGILLDPALGKWGDGNSLVNDNFIDDETFLSTNEINMFELWERRTGANGIGLNINFPDSDDKTALLNWNLAKLYNPFISADYELQHLYDLTIFYSTNTSVLQSGETLEREIGIELLDPDFDSPLFTRWDLQQFFTISNGLVFPFEINSYLEIYNTTDSPIGILNISAEKPSYIFCAPANNVLTVNANSYSYKAVKVTSSIVYEDKVADIALSIESEVIRYDLVNKRIFIPQTPVSEEGLLIVQDSINVSGHPDVELIFSVQNEQTGVIQRNITKENVFLYENGSRINEFTMGKFTGGGSSLVDIVFVLDVTGSMGGEINDVKNNIVEFAENLTMSGYDYRLGLVTFLDVVENVYQFTPDVEQFQNHINEQYAHGGGDGPENSLDALMEATKFNFRNGAKRTAIWITDAGFHEQERTTSLSIADVVEELLNNGIVVHCIGNSLYQARYYNPIIIPTGGNFYDINGNFRDILLDVSNIDSADRYILTYNSTSSGGENEISLNMRYAGLGGSINYYYTLVPGSEPGRKLSFFPNPFNPAITFNVDVNESTGGSITIYNILGQVVKEFNLTDRHQSSITWNAVNNFGQLISTGFYIVQLTLNDRSKNRYTETAKILYLK